VPTLRPSELDFHDPILSLFFWGLKNHPFREQKGQISLAIIGESEALSLAGEFHG